MSHYFIPNPAVEFFNTIAPQRTFVSVPYQNAAVYGT